MNPQGIYIFIHGENFPASHVSHEEPLVTFHYTDWWIGVLLDGLLKSSYNWVL